MVGLHRTRARLASLALVLVLAIPPALVLPSTAAGDSPTPVPLAFINASAFSDTRYLIVTGSAYASTMQGIADWKTQKGLPAKVALIEDIKATYPGRDDAEKLHNFLQDVFFNASKGELKYVLLGGGVALIPIRYLHTEGNVITWYTHDDVFSDVYYAGLNSNWDSNFNGIYGEYGEEDWDANVYVGRLPFNSVAEATIARDNILSYEKTPLLGAWMKKAVAFASVMDPPNNVPVASPPQAYAYDWFEDNAIRSVRNAQPYVPAQMSLDILADYYELDGGNYTPSGDRLSTPSMISAISGGASVVLSVTHGWVPSGKGVPEYRGVDGVDYSWGNGLTYQNATEFTNYGALSFGYFSSCLIGNFSDPALPNFARFALLQNHGFIALILPTDGTLRGEDDFLTLGISEGNWWQSENYWKNFFQGSDPFRPGPALFQGIRDYHDHIRAVNRDEAWGGYRTQKAAYNLIGDPEVPIWTDIAQSFNATMPSVLYTAEQHVRGTLRDGLGRAVPGATVAIAGAGVYAVVTTDAAGRLDAIVSPASTGTVTLTATLHNFIPYTVTIPVTAAPADLSIGPGNVSLPTPQLQAGQAAPISFTVRNVGQQAASTTDARVYDTPPGGLPQLVAASVPLSALGPGESVVSSFDWAPAEEGVHTLRIVVDPANAVAEFDELNNEASLEVQVSSVDLWLDPASLVLDPPGTVAPGGPLTVTGSVGHSGVAPRAYLIGYEARREDGSLAVSGNVEASPSLSQFRLNLVLPDTGLFSLRVTLDFENVILEFNESNNEALRAVRAGAGPSVRALPAVTLDEDAPATPVLPDLRAYISDPDTPFGLLLFDVSSSAPQLTVWVEGAALYALSAPDFSGSGTIGVTVNDGRYFDSGATAFTVRPLNDPPTIDPPPSQELVVGEPFVLALRAADPDGDPLTFSSTDPAFPVDPASGVVALIPSAGLVGTHTVEFRVTDGSRAASAGVDFVVLPANHPPKLVDPGPIEVERGAPAAFTLLAHDEDGDPVTFFTGSSQVALAPDGTLRLSAAQTAAIGANESLVIPITLSDGLASSSAQIRIVPRGPAASTGEAGSASVDSPALVITAVVFAAVGAGIALTLARRSSRRRRA